MKYNSKPPEMVYCQNENARYLTCDFVDAIVCEKCRCRCHKTYVLTDEEIQDILDKQKEKL